MTGSSGYMAGVGELFVWLLWLSAVGIVAVLGGAIFGIVWLIQHVRVV